MFSFVPDLYAMSNQASAEGGPGMYGQLALFGAIFVIFFLLVIRPQQKKQKMHKEMLSSAKKGDQIVTNSGIYGKIDKYFDDKDYFLLEIADRTVIRVQKNQIGEILRPKASGESEKSKGKVDTKDKA